MGLPNILRQRTEERINQSVAENPIYQIGIPIRTSDVVDNARANPFFFSLSSLAPVQLDKVRDTAKDGWSVMTRVPGVNKAGWTHISPLFLDGMDGGPAGQWALSGGSYVELQLLHTGPKFKMPTVIGVHTRPAPKGNETVSPRAQDEIVVKGTGSLKGPIPLGPPTRPIESDSADDEVAPFQPTGVQIDPTLNTPAIRKILGIGGLPNLDPDKAKSNPTILANEGTSPSGKSLRVGVRFTPNHRVDTIASGTWSAAMVDV